MYRRLNNTSINAGSAEIGPHYGIKCIPLGPSSAIRLSELLLANMMPPQLDQVEIRNCYRCPVCLENVRWRLPVATQCGHVFCGHCLVTAIINCSDKCPVCGQDLKEPLYFSICLLLPSPGSGKMGTVRRTDYRSRPVAIYDNPIEGRLKNGVIKDAINVKDEEPYTCLVCQGCVLQRRPVSTRCGHVFCQDCLVAVAAGRVPKCPYCKGELEKDKIVRIYL